MKLRISHNGFEWTCIDDATYGGPGDIIGTGNTQEEAKRDFWEQWLNREAMRDIKRAKSAMESWDGMLRKLCGLAS